MNIMSRLLPIIMIYAALTVTGCGEPEADTQSPRPNILLILTDDQGFGDVHSHGNDLIHTPVHDQLAADGARFDRFFVSPVCAPTRASLLTGRYHLRTGVHGVTRGQETMRSEEQTLAEILKNEGYATGCFGKWHNGAHYPQHPNGQGFDEFYGFCAGHWNNYFDTELEHNGLPVKTEGFMIDVLTDKAIEFIQTNQDRPWLCYVPYNTPHTPWQVPDSFWEKYDSLDIEDDKIKCAYAMVENIDFNMGRLLDAVKEMNLEQETIVIFMTDNGANSDRYNAGMRGRKGSLHEGGTRVPFFIKWPRNIKPGTVVNPITAHIDILPTLVELAGINAALPLPLDGKSLVPLLKGESETWPKRTLFTHWGGNLDPEDIDRGAVRTDQWRAVKYQEWELFDMQKDPSQTENVAEAHPEIVQNLSAAFKTWITDAVSSGFSRIPSDIGHQAHPLVVFPGHEADLYPEKGKGISYFERNGWANDWITNWTDLSSYPSWPVQVVTAGKYEIILSYVCAQENVGAEVEVSIGDQKISGNISEAHNPPFLHSPDRVKRKEVYEKVWKNISLGTLDLQPGKSDLEVKAISKAGTEVMDLKAVKVKKVEN